MKKQHFISLIVVLSFLLSSFSFAQSDNTETGKSKYEIIEANYLTGLNSDNLGLKISCAYFLGEMKSQKAVIPLMQMLKNNTHDGARIMAAWSLSKIGDRKGIDLLRKTADYCDCISLQCMSQHFLLHYELTSNGAVDYDKFATFK